MQETLPHPHPVRWLAPLMLILGGGLLAVCWILLSLYLGRPCGWMAVAAALMSALMLRLGGMQRGWTRMAWATAATLLLIALANWCIAAAHIGASLGLDPFDSALKMGFGYAWTLARLANGTADLVWMAVALPTAALAAR
jgi:hypothetical protein